MKIAIQASDLDWPRIDGTRVYILNVLRHLGKLSPADNFFIYHRKDFNPELTPPDLENYKIKKLHCPLFWTQLRFAHEISMLKPDRLWMPMHNIPLMIPKNIKTTITIHDLAFKIFSECFPKNDLAKLNFLTKIAIERSDKIIAISESCKEDILKFYPFVSEQKIKVIHHGFDEKVYSGSRDPEKEKQVKEKFKIHGDYLLYSGALQPRKNLELLVEAFDKYKEETRSGMNLVLVGEKAWLWKGIERRISQSRHKDDIIAPGRISFEDLGHLMRGCVAYVFPSLYEGFGIPVLEAMAAGVPVVCANNSSLPEVGGRAVLYFEGHDVTDLANKINEINSDAGLREKLIERGKLQIKKFSWEKCARETLDYIKK